MRKIPWQSWKELHLQLTASCGVYHGLPPWFSMHFKSIATFLAKSANEKIRSVDERWHLRSASSASITSPSHWPCGDVWVRACNVRLPQGLSYSMNVVGKQRLCKARDCHQILTSSRTVRQRTAKRRPAVLSTVRKVWMVRSTGAGARKLFERVADEKRHAKTDTARDGGSTSEWPFLQTNLFVVKNSTISFQVFFASWSTSILAVVSAAVCNSASAGCWDRVSARCAAAHVLIDEHASRARPSSAVAVFEIE